MLVANTISERSPLRTVIKIAAMKTLASRIAHYRKVAGMSQAGLAKACGWKSQSRVGNYESGTREPTFDDVEQMAKALGVDPSELLIGPTKVVEQANTEPAPANRGNIPLISWVQAGSFQEATEAYAPGMAEEYLPCPVPHSTWTFALRVRGDSMFNPHGGKSFSEGDVIYVDPEVEAINRSFVVVKLVDEQEASFKQLVIEGSHKYLKAINPAWPEPFFQIDGDAVIQGVVIAKLEKV